jgi:FAD/FMN-containing dehydrogenase
MWTNWSGGQQGRPRATDRPLDEAGVVAAVLRAADRGRRIRPVGAGYSWSPLAVTDEVQLDCSALTGIVSVGPDRVRVRAGARLGDLLAALAEHDLTLASLPATGEVTVAGAIATGTHGSGAASGSLSAAVRGVRLVDGTGAVREIDGPDLDAARTGLGALGIVTEIDLGAAPAHLLAAREQLRPLTELLAEDFLDAHGWTELEVFGDGQALARWADPVPVADGAAEDEAGVRYPVRAAAVGSAEALGRVVTRLAPALRRSASRWSGSTTGRPAQVLLAHRPVRAEVTEWALPRAAVGPALRELHAAAAARGVGSRMPVQVRVGAAETGWLHPAYGRATAWVAVRVPRGTDPLPLFTLAGSVLRDADGRPHWGTRHDWIAADVAMAYPRWGDFRRVRDRLDPGRLFAGPHVDAVLGS